MKIKRFEAPSMSEALRLIKKEFGEEAVILSAKNLKKPGRLFGVRAAGQVVVTAAIDRTPVKVSGDQAQLEDGAAADTHNERPVEPTLKSAEGISRILQRFTPITRTGQKKLQPKLTRLMNESRDHQAVPVLGATDRSLFERLRDQGVASGIAAEMAEKGAELIPADSPAQDDELTVISQIISAKGWLAPLRPSDRGMPRTVVLVGPNGTGKTTTAAKMAARAILNTDEKVALLSLDDHRIAGTAELARYADVMGVPFETAGTSAQLSAALDRIADAQLIVVDTPGLSPSDTTGQAALASMLKMLSDPEIHLLVSAVCQEQVIARTIRFYRPLGISRMLPTHLDWCRQIGPFINQMSACPLPITFLSTGPRVPDDLSPVTPRHMAAMLLSVQDITDGLLDSAEQDAMGRQSPVQPPSGQFVANRNSDIFHDRTCKSVRRINDEHIRIFKDPGDAINQGFKPCRMCCMAWFVPKPIERLAQHRVAGSRN